MARAELVISLSCLPSHRQSRLTVWPDGGGRDHVTVYGRGPRGPEHAPEIQDSYLVSFE